MAVIAFLFFLLHALYPATADVKGAISLDRVSFPKVVGSPHFDVLVKFDKSYAYGDKEDQFKEFTKTIGEAPGLTDLLVAVVAVEDYGAKTNDDLREQFNINADDFPVYWLFKRNSKEPIPFTGEVAATQLLLFVKQTLGVWIGLPGCLERYDVLADGFLSLNPTEQAAKAEEATALLAKENDEADKVVAEFYVETLKSIVANGNKALVEAKQAAEKESDASIKDHKRNVLASFTKYRCKSGQTGCLREMDALASTFLTVSESDRADILAKVQALTYTDEEDKENAKVYIGCFKRILEKGAAYVSAEKARLNKLLGSQVSDNKKMQFKFKLVVLGVFEP